MPTDESFETIRVVPGGSISYPRVWLCPKREAVILTNHRAGTTTLNDAARACGYIELKHQWALKEYERAHDIRDYSYYMFVKCPYSRCRAIFPGIMCYTRNDDIMSVKRFKSYMLPEEVKLFEKTRRSGNPGDWDSCLDLFVKYYDRYCGDSRKYTAEGDELVAEWIDGHILGQADPLMYERSLILKSDLMRLEDLGTSESKRIQVKLFGKALPRAHATPYRMSKGLYLTKTFIDLTNSKYSLDFELFGYEQR